MLKQRAEEYAAFLRSIPEVKSTKIIGSLEKGTADRYSDIDIEVDVAGMDNGRFLLELPRLLGERYDIIFCDFAPSLAPDRYVITVATDVKNPFGYLDISCVASPHHNTVTAEELRNLNNLYDHTLKVFAANVKHYLRGVECHEDIVKMYARVFQKQSDTLSEEIMLKQVYDWLKGNGEGRHKEYLARFEGEMEIGRK